MFVFGIKLFLLMALLLVAFPLVLVIARVAFDPNRQTDDDVVPLVIRSVICLVVCSIILAVAFPMVYSKANQLWTARWQYFDADGRRLVQGYGISNYQVRVYHRPQPELDPTWTRWSSLPRFVQYQFPRPNPETALTPPDPLPDWVQERLADKKIDSPDSVEILVGNRLLWRLHTVGASIVFWDVKMPGVDLVVFEKHPGQAGVIGVARFLSLKNGIKQVDVAASLGSLPELKDVDDDGVSEVLVHGADANGFVDRVSGKSDRLQVLRWREGKLVSPINQ